MAKLNGVQDLEECLLDEVVVPNIGTAFRDAREQVSLRAILQNYIGAVFGIHDFEQGDNIGMMAGLVVQLDFPLLESSLAGIQSNLVQGLDRVLDLGEDILRGVDNAVSSHTQYSGYLKPAGKQKSYSVLRSTYWRSRRWRRRRKHINYVKEHTRNTQHTEPKENRAEEREDELRKRFFRFQ
jgi:hypothetical protein